MNISFRQLRLFLALADTGSVTGAARALHVTQPTASMQLREVGDAVGVPLYEVVQRRVRLTDAGQDLARTARAMVDEWEAFGQRIDAQKGLTRGQLRVSVVSTAESFMPRLLGGFCERHPDVDVQLQVLNRDGVVARLRDSLDDLYIMSMPPADIALDDQVFMANPLVLVAPAGHRLAGAARVALHDLRDERFVLREKGSGTRIAADACFRRHGFSPSVRLELGSNEAVKESVAGGLGLAVLSVHALGADLAAQGVAVLPVDGFPIPSQWHVVRRRTRVPSPIAAAFERHLLALVD
ncbi:MAG TPA: LysR family transcriptional regulator [Aquabacterium sp.]|nr:LysR family transcriptional regulator [Aquabacterium sp.]